MSAIFEAAALVGGLFISLALLWLHLGEHLEPRP